MTQEELYDYQAAYRVVKELENSPSTAGKRNSFTVVKNELANIIADEYLKLHEELD